MSILRVVFIATIVYLVLSSFNDEDYEYRTETGTEMNYN